jgi:hypothetical protein
MAMFFSNNLNSLKCYFTSFDQSNFKLIILNNFYIVFLDSASAADRSDLLMELYILKEVNKSPHPNVIKLIGAFTSEGIYR